MEECGAGVRRDIEEDGGGGRKKYVNLKGGVAKATQKASKCKGFLTSLLTTLKFWNSGIHNETFELLLAGHKLRAQVTVHPFGDSSPGLVTVCPSAQASCAQDAATIAAFLSRNRPGILERIDLDRNPLVGPTGLSALAQAIPGTALRSLSLAGSQVCGVAVADAARNQALWMHDATAVEELADIRPGPPAALTRP